MKVENENLRKLSKSYKHHIDVINFSAHETYEHFLAKARVSYYLKKNKRQFCTEAIFTNGKRADIFDLSWGCAFEILLSESMESIELKKQSYPCSIFPLKAKDIIKCDYDNLYKYLN